MAMAFKPIGDLERVLARVALRSARPRDLASLRDGLQQLPALRSGVARTFTPDEPSLMATIQQALATPTVCLDLLERAVALEPAAMVRDGGLMLTLFSSGYAENQHFRVLVLQVEDDTTLATATWADGSVDSAAPVKGWVVLASPGESAVEFDISLQSAAVPEPTSWALLIMGFSSLGAALRARR